MLPKFWELGIVAFSEAWTELRTSIPPNGKTLGKNILDSMGPLLKAKSIAFQPSKVTWVFPLIHASKKLYF